MNLCIDKWASLFYPLKLEGPLHSTSVPVPFSQKTFCLNYLCLPVNLVREIKPFCVENYMTPANTLYA
jgi:hypothetical protein